MIGQPVPKPCRDWKHSSQSRLRKKNPLQGRNHTMATRKRCHVHEIVCATTCYMSPQPLLVSPIAGYNGCSCQEHSNKQVWVNKLEESTNTRKPQRSRTQSRCYSCNLLPNVMLVSCAPASQNLGPIVWATVKSSVIALLWAQLLFGDVHPNPVLVLILIQVYHSPRR